MQPLKQLYTQFKAFLYLHKEYKVSLLGVRIFEDLLFEYLYPYPHG